MPKKSKGKTNKKPSSGRDVYSYNQGMTASLRLQHKNTISAAPSMIYKGAELAATTVNSYLLTPLLNAASTAIYGAAMPSEHTQPSKAQIKERQLEVEADSIRLTKTLEELETEIKKLEAKKKAIDKAEKSLKAANRTNGTSNKLTDDQAQQRIALMQKIDDLQLQKINALEGLIQEHATRRVDFTFLLMIAVYKKNLVISKGKTELQHGKGNRDTGTAACHTSLIPHPEFKPADLQSTSSLLSTFFSAAPATPTDAEAKTFLSDNYFMDVLNATTELPVIVNQFDKHMEGLWGSSNAVNATIDILNQVSIGTLTPQQGMDQFGRVMSMFFSHIEYRYVLPELEYNPNSPVLYPKAFNKVWQLQQTGTLTWFNIQREPELKVTLRQDYLACMLNLHGFEKLSSNVYNGHIARRYKAMQDEILSSASPRIESKAPSSSSSNIAF